MDKTKALFFVLFTDCCSRLEIANENKWYDHTLGSHHKVHSYLEIAQEFLPQTHYILACADAHPNDNRRCYTHLKAHLQNIGNI